MNKSNVKKFKVTLIKSPIAAKPSHRACVRSLGLRKLNSANEVKGTESVLGIIHEIRHLLRIEEIQA